MKPDIFAVPFTARLSFMLTDLLVLHADKINRVRRQTEALNRPTPIDGWLTVEEAGLIAVHDAMERCRDRWFEGAVYDQNAEDYWPGYRA